jgi:hypothetical protein
MPRIISMCLLPRIFFLSQLLKWWRCLCSLFSCIHARLLRGKFLLHIETVVGAGPQLAFSLRFSLSAFCRGFSLSQLQGCGVAFVPFFSSIHVRLLLCHILLQIKTVDGAAVFSISQVFYLSQCALCRGFFFSVSIAGVWRCICSFWSCHYFNFPDFLFVSVRRLPRIFLLFLSIASGGGGGGGLRGRFLCADAAMTHHTIMKQKEKLLPIPTFSAEFLKSLKSKTERLILLV